MPRYIVIGGVAGGASTAARLRRLDENADILLIERGQHISYANCGLPYYAGGTIAERDRLFVMTPDKFRSWLNVDVRVATEATGFDAAARTVMLRNLATGAQTAERYDALVLSPGAEPLRPPIPGIDTEGIYTLRSVPDVDAIRKRLDEKRPERAVVIGGGFIGLEMAENLHERGCFVTVVEALDQVMNPLDPEMAAMVHHQLKAKNVELYLGDGVSSFERKGSRVLVKLSSGAELPSDMVILSIGVRPDTAFARASGVACAPNGAILVDERMRTNLDGVYGLGDAAAFNHPILGKALGVPLAGPANKQARVVAESIVRGDASDRVWKGAIGTSIAKVFDIVAASTGVAQKVLEKNGIAAASMVTHGSSHAGYYPGALPLTIKTVFDPLSGRLYGAQVVGYEGVDKRIDLLAEAVRRGASVTELAEIEHAYAPPFSSAKDPVNIAGMAAENLLAGLTKVAGWKDVSRLKDEGAFLLDVRSADEFALGSIPGARNIPVDELRSRLSEVPRDVPVLAFCGVGLRGYLAERVLRQRGWTEVMNLSGGYKTWELATEKQSNTGIYQPGMAGLQGASRAPALLGETYSEGSGMPERLARHADITVRVDACGLQCPGPIMRLKAESDKLPPGGTVVLSATDPGFARDVQAWAGMTGNEIVSVESSGGIITAVIRKGSGKKASSSSTSDGATFIVFSDDMDKALASFVLANGAASAGKKPTMFFTFWGLSVLKRRRKPAVRKDFMGRMFSMMLPGHLGDLSLSKMNFGGLGALMMKFRMKAKRVDQLETMLDQALKAGVRLVACQMSMDIMGVNREELVDGVEIGGVATYMEAASGSNVNLFI